MANSTPRRALLQPVTTDAPSELRIATTNHATTLDNTIDFLTGTVSARPAANAVVTGSFYYATDTAVMYQTNGTAWSALVLAGNGIANLSWHGMGAGTIAAGQFAYPTANAPTFTLPTPVANTQVGIQGPVPGISSGLTTVAYGAGGGRIFGGGLISAASFQLGVPSAVILHADGANWNIISGQPDTGWQPLTIPTGMDAGIGLGGRTPAARLQGDVVGLKGTLENNGTVNTPLWPAGTAIATIPNASMYPVVKYSRIVMGRGGGGTAGNLLISTSGVITLQNDLDTLDVICIDGLGYPLT